MVCVGRVFVFVGLIVLILVVWVLCARVLVVVVLSVLFVDLMFVPFVLLGDWLVVWGLLLNCVSTS